MMAGWMLYTLLTSLLLILGGGALEQLARALRSQVRVVWCSVILSASVLSGTSLLHRATPEPLRAPIAAAGTGFLENAAPKVGAHSGVRLNGNMPQGRRSAANPLRVAISQLRELSTFRLASSWKRYDAFLAMSCASLALTGLFVVCASFIRLRRKCRMLDASELDGVAVLMSRDLGPAVFGALTPRVIIPRWMISLDPIERRMILLHEQQHAVARDPMLVLFSAVALALQPWNVFLWIAFARLRFAVEADCDARVLRLSRQETRSYATLLLRVCEHDVSSNRAGPLSATALVDSTSHLERRIRRMTERQPRVRSLSTMSAFVAVVLCVGVAASVRISNARDSVSPSNVEPPAVEPRVAAPVAVAGANATGDSASAAVPSWVRALPKLVNTQREDVRSATGITVSSFSLRVPLSATVADDTLRDSSTPDTLVVRASNPLWPMHARIISTGAGGMSYVSVSDTLGRLLPTADTLDVNGPVRLVLPRGRFQLLVESLGGDLMITTSPVPAPDGQGGHFTATLLGRRLSASRKVEGTPAEFQGEGASVVRGQRVP